MTMADGASRDTFVLKRGAYDAPGERVTAGVPEALPVNATLRNRLDLARWITDRANPLTARVTVNRFWQSYFGTGLVKTVDDFGSQGEWPSNPELLDWLAVEFMESGWDVKAMQKLIVMSAAYRQSSAVTPELLAKDPDNRLLARGPRLRLGPEAIRDQALAVSGLLVENNRWPLREALSTRGPVAGTRRRQRLRAIDRRRALSPQPLHLVEANLAAALHDEFRFAQSRTMRGVREPDQLTASGARSHE